MVRLLQLGGLASALRLSSQQTMQTETGANPIRRVVTLLQNMQKEIEAEGEKEEELYKKFQCYCNTNDGQLAEDAKRAEEAIQLNNAAAEQKTGTKKTTSAELKQHKKDRTEATSTLAQATELRKKEKAAYDHEAGETSDYIDATGRAVEALKAGKAGGAFLQTKTASLLKNLIMSKASDMVDANDRSTLMAFLEQSHDYVPQSGEIIGILSNMLDEFKKSLGQLQANEDEALKNFAALKAAKQSEVAAATDSIEKKTELKGALAVEIVQHQAAAAAAVKELGDAQAFLLNLKQMCADKAADWEKRSKERADEISAINEAIAVLNDDDALDIFKASIGNKASKPAFIQVTTGKKNPAMRVEKMLQAHKFRTSVAVSLLAHKAVAKLKEGVDFSKIIVMIDDMVKLLKKEAKDDEKTLNWCHEGFRTTESELKDAANKIKSLESQVAELESAIAENHETVKTEQGKIADLDKSVKEATEQRKQENEEFDETVSLNTSAVQLLLKAKNKLNKFYNPGQYQAPKQRELTDEERILQGAGADIGDTTVQHTIEGTTQTTTLGFTQAGGSASAPPPPPETYGEHKSKGGKANSVVALLDMITNELKSETQTAEADEKVAVKEYEKLMQDAAESKAESLRSISNTNAATAGMEEDMEGSKTNKGAKEMDHQELTNQLADLHNQCDFLVAHFDERLSARETEVSGLESAKAILSGADYSF